VAVSGETAPSVMSTFALALRSAELSPQRVVAADPRVDLLSIELGKEEVGKRVGDRMQLADRGGEFKDSASE
jgi:hypothetical protein